MEAHPELAVRRADGFTYWLSRLREHMCEPQASAMLLQMYCRSEKQGCPSGFCAAAHRPTPRGYTCISTPPRGRRRPPAGRAEAASTHVQPSPAGARRPPFRRGPKRSTPRTVNGRRGRGPGQPPQGQRKVHTQEPSPSTLLLLGWRHLDTACR